ncbi:hypothetical protein AU476_33405 [Cupriavidus sp. UYMSc13B]|nr:hypothetical protein AU476_33405 [Cupriavidus sp. UYMSc13B]
MQGAFRYPNFGGHFAHRQMLSAEVFLQIAICATIACRQTHCDVVQIPSFTAGSKRIRDAHLRVVAETLRCSHGVASKQIHSLAVASECLLGLSERVQVFEMTMSR